MEIAGFVITKIVIVQSLEPHESQTGSNTCGYVSAQLTEHNYEVPIEVRNCENYLEFLEILKQLTEEATNCGERPLLHVECHGSRDEGLEFANGSTLSWPALSQALLALNQACRFNLLAIFAACFGGYFLGQMHAIYPAPCWAMVAPTETVDPAEIMRGFRTFYSTFLSQADVGRAIASLSREDLSEGRWFGQAAETWFERLVTGYIEKYCTAKEVRKRISRVYRQLRRDGRHESIGKLTRAFRQNHSTFLEKYFNTFFMVGTLPENRQRFSGVYNRMEHKLSEMRGNRKYIL